MSGDPLRLSDEVGASWLESGLGQEGGTESRMSKDRNKESVRIDVNVMSEYRTVFSSKMNNETFGL